MPERPEAEPEATDTAALAQQVAKLKARVRSLEGAVAREKARFDAFTSTLPGISWETWGRPDETIVSYVSPSVEAITGTTVELWQSRPGFWLELVHPDDLARVKSEIDAILESDGLQFVQEYRWITRLGGGAEVRHAQVRFTIVRDEHGAPVVWQAFTLDVTAQKEAERQRDEMQRELIHNQESMLEALSTPLLPIAEQIVVMPLIGPVDQARAERALSVLLEGLSSSRARFAILDVTGMPCVDEDVVQALVRAAEGARLLGAEVFITGIRGEVAMAFCAQGEGLAEITTCATLKQGVARAMNRANPKAPRAATTRRTP